MAKLSRPRSHVAQRCRQALHALAFLLLGCGGEQPSASSGSAGQIGTGAGNSPGGSAGTGGGESPQSGGHSGTSSGGASGAGATSGAPIGDGKLGSRCSSDDACGAGLSCFRGDANALLGAGPAGGLCTLSCLENKAACAAAGTGATCVQFGATQAICLEGCAFGDPAASASKCHARSDLACANVIDASEAAAGVCDDDLDCGAGHSCVDGTCFASAQACLPQCASDDDCGAGRHCDRGSAYGGTGGLCRDAAPSGLATGAACQVAGKSCRGACLPVGTDAGVCADGCVFGVEQSCGWSGQGAATAACLQLMYADQGRGDAALCTPLCDCDADCSAGTICRAFPDDSTFDTRYGRVGLCVARAADAPGISCK
jgi:hypothetical protein